MAPDDTEWRFLPLGQIATTSLGGNYRNGPTSSERPLIKMGNIARITIDLSKVEYISSSEHVSDEHRLRWGDVLLNTRNTLDLVGKVSIWRDELPLAYYNSNILRLEFRPEYCGSSIYFGYALNSRSSIRAIRALATGTTSVAAIYGRDLFKLHVPVPPRSEQVRIADALTGADDQVSALVGLLRKKEAIRQGVMQHLLTGSRRHNELVAVGSVTAWLSGGTPDRSRAEYWTGTVPWISASTLKMLEVDSSDQCVTSVAVRAGSRMAPVGATLLLVRGSALHSEIRAAVVTAPVCFNQDVKALVPSRSVVPKFLAYSVHANAARLLQLVTSAGNTAGVLDTQVVKRFRIWLPALDEQRRIVGVLDEISEDLAVVKARLIKAQGVKQGMMQQLLTGCVRLPELDAVA